jgi:hypothetical protein
VVSYLAAAGRLGHGEYLELILRMNSTCGFTDCLSRSAVYGRHRHAGQG